MNDRRLYLLVIVFLASIVDIFFIKSVHTWFTITLLISWAALFKVLKFNDKSQIYAPILLFSLMPVFTILRLFEVAEKAAVWFFLYLIMKCLQEIKYLYKQNNL